MLSGRAAQQRPEVDALHVAEIPIGGHRRIQVGKTAQTWRLTMGNRGPGVVDHDSGVYRADVNRMTEAQRRAAGIRRNGQPRRRSRA